MREPRFDIIKSRGQADRAIDLKGLNFPLCLAPMVGLSHIGLRAMVRSYLPEGAITIWPSEMLNSRRLPHEDFQKTPEAMKLEDETHWVPQILGNEEEAIRKSILKLKAHGASAIDINMGCPVKKALRHNYGVALMGDSKYAAQVVKMAKGASDLPVSVKLRVGPQKNLDEFLEFLWNLESAGADWLTFHPRTTEQKRRGNADWGQIERVGASLKIPLIGNGDIQTVEDVFALLEQTKVSMAMIGRAATARPWIFWQVGERLGFPPPPGRTGKAPCTAIEEGEEYGRFLESCFKIMLESFNENYAIRKLHFLVRTGAPWLSFGQDLFSKVTQAKTPEHILKNLQAFFSVPQPMLQKTELRQ